MKALGEPCTIPAWALSNLAMAAGCGVALEVNSAELREARKALGIDACEDCSVHTRPDGSCYLCTDGMSAGSKEART